MTAVVLAGASLVTASTATPAAAAISYVVDTTADNGALTACTAAADDCSLRGAVAEANVSVGVDTIDFDIPAASCPDGVCRLTLVDGPLTITEAVNLDGTTQPQNDAPQANVCATATAASYMRIEIVSDPASGSATVFSVENATDATTIRGLALGSNDSSFFTPGILMNNGTGHQIACNHFALDGPGENHLGTGDFTTQIDLEADASHVIIGTDGDGIDDLAERNVFGDTGANAIYLNGDAGSSDHTVAGNYVGFTADGATQLGGGQVYMRQIATGNVVGSNMDGTSDDLERNYFGGATGVRIDGSTSPIVDNEVVGNVFGITPTGAVASITTAVDVSGLLATSSGNEIRDNYIGAANVGIALGGDAAGVGFLIDGNVFGTGPDDSSHPNAISIRLSGVGSSVISNNRIVGSTTAGLSLAGTAAVGSGSTGNCIADNNAGATNTTGSSVTLENNWWGSASGPSGAGTGTGDSVSPAIDFTPWLTTAPAACGASVTVGDAGFTVAEDAAVGTTVGTVTATGSGTLGYSITAGNTGDAFAIDPAAGVITTATALDYETTPTYALTVEAASGLGSDTATITITVTDVTDMADGPSFDDVPTTHTFHGDVEWLAAEAITRGCNPPANTLFCPDDSVTRGQMAAFLHRALVDVLVPGAPVTFDDSSGSVFAADIVWLGSVGVTRGCNPPVNDMFCPDDSVTRGQMAAFLVRALRLSDDGGGNTFVDDDGSVFEMDIARLSAAGITRGCNPPTNDMFCPDDPVTRAQMAAFLHRALGP
jgi:hypothetical protein